MELNYHTVQHLPTGSAKHRSLQVWLEKNIALTEKRERDGQTFHPVITKFKDLIEQDARIFRGFCTMFEEVPNRPPYNQNSTEKSIVRDYLTMLKLFDLFLTVPPIYDHSAEITWFPFSNVLDWPMGTTSGREMFADDIVNAQFEELFSVWAAFLSSPESCYVLEKSDPGWLGPGAMSAMVDFEKDYVCDPKAPYHGYNSWDEFFTRTLRPGARPVAEGRSIVTAACESAVYRISDNVKFADQFWIKGETYSLEHMLYGDPLAEQFAGGTVYQGYLSGTNYHRWQSPVDGTIAKILHVRGTYFLDCLDAEPTDPKSEAVLPGIPNISLAFHSSMATRTLIFIQADNKDIGMMCFIAVGLTEVSSCEATVKEGDRVMKGNGLGMFHCGGSAYCLVFRPEVNIQFSVKVGSSVKVNSAIGEVYGSR